MSRSFEVHMVGDRWCLMAHDSMLGSYLARDTAIAEALRLAQGNVPSRLIIRRCDGSTELERHFDR
jgi:hypothetical protein